MTGKDKEHGGETDPVAALGEIMGATAQQWQEGWSDWVAMLVPSGDGKAPGEAPAQPKIGVDPAKMLEAQMELWHDFQTLWAATTARMMGKEAAPVIEPDAGDNRFRDPEWSDNPIFDFLKQSYLLNARWLRRSLAGIEGLDRAGAEKLDFVGRQIVDAFSPGNFALTNPVVLREMRETKGESLMRGLQQLAEDLKDSEHGLRPRQTDMDAFEVGGNVATAPGAVVHRTEVMQLIQYEPSTETVYRKPLLIVPPWINKFYILDLRPDNSFIRWAVDRGYTVFVISWVNPDESHAALSFDDYLRDGILASLEAIERATGERQTTAIGYCIGGTLLAAALAYMDAVGDERIGAATFFAAQVDFEDAGELRIFTDEAHMDALEDKVREKGYLDAADMAGTFNALRANDLIWHFVINNYLLGKEPPAFDLLYWNADSTHFPAQLFIDYLRNMYQRNNLARPGEFELLGEKIDLGRIGIPTYIQASKEDHIAPAGSVFKLTRLFGGKKRFVLAGSGHIAGVINPPEKKKYQHWLVEGDAVHDDFESWFADAAERPGSWWPDWHRWLSRRSGKKVPARKPGEGELGVIEPAPGSYVKRRS
ncbi:MAG: class I poly(R)-hydroxyalkanoic acid synthase [Defluviicoccus sp.]|nr:class I poly(R)-hydroxyalkanoic acid synthase [Defluviicoccus sp.]MDE0276466.1 class I poly(R)-hydroxyalkanoic acid synthase [Defluviicoccus sp.]